MATRNNRSTRKRPAKRYAVLIVHGIGEQRWYGTTEDIAANFFNAAKKRSNCRAHLEVRPGGESPRHSDQPIWKPAAARLWWQQDNAPDVELEFREVYWADLDKPDSFTRWTRFVYWALSVSGIRMYNQSANDKPEQAAIRPPKVLSNPERFAIRARLFGISVLFLLMLLSADLLYFALTRFGFRAQWLRTARGMLYDFLDDIELYQDWRVRGDDHLEAVGGKSKVAICRRMVRALLFAAADCEQISPDYLDGYYVFAHSLGTVAAFNALMETSWTFPDYLTESEWNNLPSSLKARYAPGNNSQAPLRASTSARAPWLKENDAIDREKVMNGLKGFISVGSPLDKFAALWPAIVPINNEKTNANVPWINVSDVQDIVADSLILFPSDANGTIGGLKLKNYEWSDQPVLFLAHTQYWKNQDYGQPRLVDQLLDFFSGRDFERPANRRSPAASRLVYVLSLIVLGLFALWVAATLACFVFDHRTVIDIVSRLDRLSYCKKYWKWIPITAFGAIATVFVCSLVRNLYEHVHFSENPHSE